MVPYMGNNITFEITIPWEDKRKNMNAMNYFCFVIHYLIERPEVDKA
jgi:hypothetical protein